MSYLITIRGGETHIILSDVENNPGGVTFTLFNDLPVHNSNIFYFDHSSVGGTLSGNGTPGNAQPTSIPFIYSNNFGNN